MGTLILGFAMSRGTCSGVRPGDPARTPAKDNLRSHFSRKHTGSLYAIAESAARIALYRERRAKSVARCGERGADGAAWKTRRVRGSVPP